MSLSRQALTPVSINANATQEGPLETSSSTTSDGDGNAVSLGQQVLELRDQLSRLEEMVLRKAPELEATAPKQVNQDWTQGRVSSAGSLPEHLTYKTRMYGRSYWLNSCYLVYHPRRSNGDTG